MKHKQPKQPKPLPNLHTVMGIGDLQYPFAHSDHMDFLYAVKRRYHPDVIVCIGDEVDFHALSDYDHSPTGMSAGEELTAARKDLGGLYELFPVVKSCISNHTSRPYRRAEKFGIPEDFIKGYRELLAAPRGWEWAQSWKIDDVMYFHGEGLSGKMAHLRAAERLMQSVVMGHLHTNAGIEYSANPFKLIFGFALGCLVDQDKYAFAYARHNIAKPILGCGIVDHGIPMFIPMRLRKDGSWTGRLVG